jgi:hypothetical protein
VRAHLQVGVLPELTSCGAAVVAAVRLSTTCNALQAGLLQGGKISHGVLSS